MIHFLIWDAGGTLFDTYPSAAFAFRKAINDFGNDAPVDWIEGLARRSLGYCTKALAREFGLDPADLKARFLFHYEAIPAEQQPPFPGVIDICAYICDVNAGHCLGKNFIITHRWRSSLLELLNTHHMLHYFTDYITMEDGYPRKPDPTSTNAIIEKYALEREAVLAIGDRNLDILAGQAAQIRTCFFDTEAHDAQPDFEITDFRELYTLLVAENSRAIL